MLGEVFILTHQNPQYPCKNGIIVPILQIVSLGFNFCRQICPSSKW